MKIRSFNIKKLIKEGKNAGYEIELTPQELAEQLTDEDMDELKRKQKIEKCPKMEFRVSSELSVVSKILIDKINEIIEVLNRKEVNNGFRGR